MKIIETAQAAITNPAVGNLGNDPDKAADGSLFLSQIVRYWNNIISIGGLLLLLFFVWGALQWITASGDKTKLEAARNRMLQAAIGLLILVSSFVIIGFVGNLLFGDTFQVLNFKFFTPE
ncbi:MAG TPA: hypothetical protein PKJ26_00480 [Candidatus Woesebacteria bacterium]|nr:hypothetical protein [Candidatus Woesebacteria bacterium]HNS64953.1 hypothetical protein [Candidatus Woesebacteria bacterium]